MSFPLALPFALLLLLPLPDHIQTPLNVLALPLESAAKRGKRLIKRSFFETPVEPLAAEIAWARRGKS